MGIIDFTMPEVGSFLVEIIIWLVKISSSIALGIVLFTVILKLITLPFDYFSRASMRKNSLKMEEMRPELEKLQKQYADNKDLYSQKMMALYKKNGYSMFGSCLPTILTLVIFIVAINAFTDYSQYQNKMDFYHMSQSYNNVVYAGFDIDDNYIIRDADGNLIIKNDLIAEKVEKDTSVILENTNVNVNHKTVYRNDEQGNPTTDVLFYQIEVWTANGYSLYKRSYTYNGEGVKQWQTPEYTLSENAVSSLKSNIIATEENNGLKNSQGKTFEEAYAAEVRRIEEINAAKAEGETLEVIPTEQDYANLFVNDIQSYMAALRYREEQASFLWIKNIWVTDSAMKHPVESSWDSFKGTHEYTGNNIGDAGYNKLIEHLDKETSEPNGYFILVVLTALSSLLTQIVTGKSQKAQMELQTVDGQGAQTQKIMKWMMPIMMAFFAFMYTSAFSIYIILSSLISLLTTFGINFIVDRKYKKDSSTGSNETIRGRIYTPKEEEKKESKPVKKKNESSENDFLSGKADHKKGNIRGRLK